MEEDKTKVPELTGRQFVRLQECVVGEFSIRELETAIVSATDNDLDYYAADVLNKPERVKELFDALKGEERLWLFLKILFYKSGPEREAKITRAWEEIIPEFKTLFPDEPSEDAVRQSGYFQEEAAQNLVNIGIVVVLLLLVAGFLAYLYYPPQDRYTSDDAVPIGLIANQWQGEKFNIFLELTVDTEHNSKINNLRFPPANGTKQDVIKNWCKEFAQCVKCEPAAVTDKFDEARTITIGLLADARLSERKMKGIWSNPQQPWELFNDDGDRIFYVCEGDKGK